MDIRIQSNYSTTPLLADDHIMVVYFERDVDYMFRKLVEYK